MTTQPEALLCAEVLEAARDDPMWADHAEITKEACARSAAELRRLAAVEAQRDALLEALKRMASIIDKMGDMPDGFIHPSPWQTLKCEEALEQARAAIAKAEEA